MWLLRLRLWMPGVPGSDVPGNGMVFAIFAPMNHNFEHMTPDNFDEYYPDTNDGTAIPADKGSILPAYELSESFAVVSVDF